MPLERFDYDEIDRRWCNSNRKAAILNRVRFNKWKLEFTVNYDENRVSIEKIKAALEEGSFNGIGSHKPRYGRFKVMAFNET